MLVLLSPLAHIPCVRHTNNRTIVTTCLQQGFPHDEQRLPLHCLRLTGHVAHLPPINGVCYYSPELSRKRNHLIALNKLATVFPIKSTFLVLDRNDPVALRQLGLVNLRELNNTISTARTAERNDRVSRQRHTPLEQEKDARRLLPVVVSGQDPLTYLVFTRLLNQAPSTANERCGHICVLR